MKHIALPAVAALFALAAAATAAYAQDTTIVPDRGGYTIYTPDGQSSYARREPNGGYTVYTPEAPRPLTRPWEPVSPAPERATPYVPGRLLPPPGVPRY